MKQAVKTIKKIRLPRVFIEDPICTCGKAVQTTDHLIFEFGTLTKERKKLRTTALQKGNYPINKKDLTI
jgi:hypothetical protein